MMGYMDASRLPRVFLCFSKQDKTAVLYPALLQDISLRAPMEFADLPLILLADY